MSVCIIGMHRSGTSMVARLLHLCGLYLGPEDQLVPPGDGNPTGFWENRAMDEVNEAVLAHLSGGWDFLLPPMPVGWEADPGLERLRHRAAEIIKSLSRKEPWGWKDPRASITLPFWKALIPDLKIVVCLRDPVEVVRSLHKRVGGTDAFGYNLWLRYHRIILTDTDPGERLVTHYKLYFIDPLRELRRLTDWLGWPVDDQQLGRAIEAINTTREQQITAFDSREQPVPSQVAHCYHDLCQAGGASLQSAMAAGEIPQPSVTDDVPPTLPAKDTITEGQRRRAQETFLQGQQHLEHDDHDKAMACFAETVELDPFHSQAHNDLGVLLLSIDQPDQAVAQLALASRLAPAHADTARNLAEAYTAVGRLEDAVKTCLAVIAKHPRDEEALLWLALASSRLGQPEQTRGYLDRLLAQNPDHSEARQLLASLAGSQTGQPPADNIRRNQQD